MVMSFNFINYYGVFTLVAFNCLMNCNYFLKHDFNFHV